MKLTASKITDIQNGSMENCTDSNRSEMLYILGPAAFFLKVITCVCLCFLGSLVHFNFDFVIAWLSIYFDYVITIIDKP